MKWLISSVLAAALAACATASPGKAAASEPAASNKAVAANAASARVCRGVTRTGSHVSKKVCRTQEEWDASDKTNRSDAEQRERLRREQTIPDSR